MSRRAGQALAAVAAGVGIGVCMLIGPVPGHPGGWMLPVWVAGLFLALLAARTAQRAYRHASLYRALLPRARLATIAGIEVEELTGIEGVFVAGLVHPRIFLSHQLGRDLAPEELRAVLLHERYHQLDRAPAKLVILEAMAPFLTMDAGRAWLTRQMAALEIAADRHALAQGASRGALARALLRFQPLENAGGVGIGFATAADLRLQALLGETLEAPTGLPVWLVGALAAAVVCLTLVALA